MRAGLLIALLAAMPVAVARGEPPETVPARTEPRPPYTWREDHDPDGIGKFYMGREIARVMGHEGAAWLERPEREREEHPQKVLRALKLERGDVVADLGAGTGYFTTRLARAVGREGRVYAVDVQPEMLAMLRQRLARERIPNVELVLGEEDDPKLPPETLDLVLMVDVYHEFAWPYEMMEHIVAALRPGGRVVFVEYRAEDPTVPIKPLHKMSEAQVLKEMTPFPLRHLETLDVLPRQHIIIFEKPAPATRPAGAATRPAEAD